MSIIQVIKASTVILSESRKVHNNTHKHSFHKAFTFKHFDLKKFWFSFSTFHFMKHSNKVVSLLRMQISFPKTGLEVGLPQMIPNAKF